MRDPRRMMCATVLVLQAVVLGLSTPVLITIEDVSRSLSLGLGLGLAVVALFLAGFLRGEWAYYAGFVLQGATLALAIFIPLMIVLGVVFASLWTAAFLLGKKIEADRATWAAQVDRSAPGAEAV